MRLEDVLNVLAALERAGVRYTVFGGLAMAAHGFHHATRDLDLFVAPVAANVERVPAGSVTITVVTPETLYRMKRDTVRLRDRDDAQRLARAIGFGSREDR
jgi:hypothetical protein